MTTSTNVTARNCALTFDELASKVGRRHLRDVLDQELELGRVTLDDSGHYALAPELPHALVLALRGIDGSTLLEEPWPTR
jgi:hypothetical protein